MLAKTLGLSNFTLIIDNNSISSITRTEEVIATGPLEQRFGGFGFHAIRVDGHNVAELEKSLKESREMDGPVVVLCDTVKGKGLSFAEDNPLWHYKPLDVDYYAKALEELV